jgi:hypothetical protein
MVAASAVTALSHSGQVAGVGAQGLDPSVEDRLQQCVAAGKVPAHGGGSDSRGAGDLLQGRVGAVRGDRLLGHGEQARVVAPGVRALSRHGVTSCAKWRGPPYLT